MLVSFSLFGAGLGVLLGYEYSLPRIQSLEDYRPDVITRVYSDDEKVFGDFAVERRIVVSYEDLPPYYVNAILAAEDDQFFYHSGINYYAILRAVLKDIIAMRKAEGASTITQQLARLLLLSPEKAWERKIKEVLLAWKIENRYSKRQILTLYCNQHYLGHGAYGVAAGADLYFGKQLKELSLEECALLAGLHRSPGRYSPRLNPPTALARRNYILDRMAAERMISAKLAAEAKARPIVLKQRTQESDLAPYFVEWVRQSLADKYTTDVIWRKGLRVYTTLSIDLQRAANKAVRDGLRTYDKRHGWRGPVGSIFKDPEARLETYSHPDWRKGLRPGVFVTGLVTSSGESEAAVRVGRYTATIGPKEIAWTRAKSPSSILKTGDLATFEILSLDDEKKSASVLLDQIPAVQGALITIENATGEIKAMVGGYDFEASEFNRATQAMRQVGSTFKPFVYSTALEQGMTAETIVVDSPISHTDALGRVWSPSNYDGKFKGRITLTDALTESRNVPTIKIASQIGIKNVVVMARRFGLTGPLEPFLPLAIGACEATPLEMASAFSVFPSMGQQAIPYFIRKVEDYEHVTKEQTFPRVRRVLEPETSIQMLWLLENVVQRGTATAAKSLGRPVAGKTGTTNDFTDAWFVGFTPSLTTAVWVGHDAKKTLGNKEAGAVVALPIWIQYMKEVLAERPAEQFPAVETTGQITMSGEPDPRRAAAKKLFVEDLPGGTAAKNP